MSIDLTLFTTFVNVIESIDSMEFRSPDRVHLPIAKIYQIAARYSRRKEEVDDLVQDLLLESVRIGKDFSDPHFMGWAHGFLRNRAAFIARTEGRRRKREETFHDDHSGTDSAGMQLPESFIRRLSPSLRVLAKLIDCGLNRKEILYLLQIADTALRQRLTALRREWKSHLDAGGQGTEQIDEPGHLLQNGLIRRALRKACKGPANREGAEAGRIFGSHDPDGHLFTIRTIPAHKSRFAGNNSNDQTG